MIGERVFTADDFRERLGKMSDEQLLRYGKAARHMADPGYSADKRTVRPVYVVQLQECLAEWLRRHPKTPSPARP
jgi:hypothetical protein